MANLRLRLWVDYYVGGILHALLKPPVMLLGKVLGRNHDLGKCETVTYVKLLGGGSLVMAYPSLVALRESGRVKRLRLLATPKTAAFGELLGVFDEIIVIRDTSFWSMGWGALRAIVKLWRTEAMVDLEIHSRLSTVLCVLTMARNRVGAFTDSSFWRRGLATHLIFYNRQLPVYELYGQVARLFGCEAVGFEAAGERFRAGMLRRGAEVAGVEAGDVALAPVCSDLARERMLRAGDWGKVLGRMDREKGGGVRRVHVLGGAEERGEIEKLCAGFREALPGVEFVNHAGKLRLEESVMLLGKVSYLICIDSALLHLGRLMGVRTESYWGPTDPGMFLMGRGAAGRDEVHYRRIGCSPCVHMANVPPCKGNNICMAFAVHGEGGGAGLDDKPVWLAQEPGKKGGG